MILDAMGDHLYMMGRDAQKAEYAVEEAIEYLHAEPDSEVELLLEMALDFCRTIHRRDKVLNTILPKEISGFETGVDTTTLMPDTAKE